MFGVIGLGRIGTAAALRAKAMGMDVIFYDPYKPDGYDKALGIRRVETLDELLAQSLVVSVHCPATDETRHMIDAAAMARMPRGSYPGQYGARVGRRFACVAGGDRVGAVGGGGDRRATSTSRRPTTTRCWSPGATRRHPAHHRLILNPHAAFYSEAGLLDMRLKAAEACRRAILGLPLRNVVNP